MLHRALRERLAAQWFGPRLRGNSHLILHYIGAIVKQKSSSLRIGLEIVCDIEHAGEGKVYVRGWLAFGRRR